MDYYRMIFPFALPSWSTLAASALAGAALAWFISANVYSARIDSIQRVYAAEKLAISEATNKALLKLSADRDSYALKAAKADSDGTQRIKEFQNAENILKSNVAAANQRLRVAATCPRSSGLPEAPSASGVDNGNAPELNTDARQYYYALRAGIVQQREQLLACQLLIKE